MIIGLDLSVAGTGVCLIPNEWEQLKWSWSVIETHRFGFGLTKGALIAEQIARRRWIAERVVEIAGDPEDADIFIEGYAFGATYNLAMLAELGGVVKDVLTVHGFTKLTTVAPSKARKYFMGKVPRRNPKPVVQRLLRRLDCPFHRNGDAADAFVVANWGLGWRGGRGMMIPAEEGKP